MFIIESIILWLLFISLWIINLDLFLRKLNYRNTLFKFILSFFIVSLLFYMPIFIGPTSSEDSNLSFVESNQYEHPYWLQDNSEASMTVLLYISFLFVIPFLSLGYYFLVINVKFKKSNLYKNIFVRKEKIFIIISLFTIFVSYAYYNPFWGQSEDKCHWEVSLGGFGAMDFVGKIDKEEFMIFFDYNMTFRLIGLEDQEYQRIEGTWDYDKEKDKMTLLFEEVSKVMESKFEKNESWNTEEKKLILDVESDSCDYEGIKLTGDDLTLDYYKVSF